MMAKTDRSVPAPASLAAAKSPLLQALVARYLDPEAARAHVGPPATCGRGIVVQSVLGTGRT